MDFCVHCAVNDGRKGFPNIIAELAWTDQTAKSYMAAARQHIEQRGAVIISASNTNSSGEIRGKKYRDFLIDYKPSKTPIGYNEMLESTSKMVRVFREA